MCHFKLQKVLIAFLFSLAIYSCSNKNFSVQLAPIPTTEKFINDSLSIWGASIVKGDDKLYHMYYSIWNKNFGWAWVTHSEIAHAVSDSPFGPYQFKDLTLPARGAQYWDGLCTHNPTVHKFSNKYYLYYMGNTGDGVIVGTPQKVQLNWTHRNNQRIGVAWPTIQTGLGSVPISH